MGDFKDNPKKPYEVKVPNKIRKRIFMHERDEVEPETALARWVRRFFGSGK